MKLASLLAQFNLIAEAADWMEQERGVNLAACLKCEALRALLNISGKKPQPLGSALVRQFEKAM